MQKKCQKHTLHRVFIKCSSILTPINEKCTALLADFGTSDDVLADVIFGKYNPAGKLPFEFHSSEEAVEKQLEDIPYDPEDLLYTSGYGLSYK